MGILTPPSIILVIYGNLTETDISQLFITGVILGLIKLLFYLGAVAMVTAHDPASGPVGRRTNWSGGFRSLTSVWDILLLFIIIIGGISFGIFTPAEAAGIGAIGSMLFALFRGKLTFKILAKIMNDTVMTTAALLMLVAGSQMFATFVNVSGLPFLLTELVTGSNIPPLVVIVLICLMFLILGCVLEAFSMILVVVVEVGLITPPVSLNVFVLCAVLPNLPLRTISRAVVPFILADLFRLMQFILFPGTVLFLP